MKQPLSFTAIHHLLSRRDANFWADYWKISGRKEGDISDFYPGYIAGLVKKISDAKVKRIFLIHKDRAFFLAGFLAALHAGVCVVLPPSDTVGLLKDLLNPEDGLLTNQNELSALTPFYISMDDIDCDHSMDFEDIDPTSIFVTFYTSGSTGTPKAVEKALKQLVEEIAVLNEMWGNQKSDGSRFLSTVPHHHIYGLLFSLLWPICAGIPLNSETLYFWEDVLKFSADEVYIISSPSHLSRFPCLSKERLKIKHIFSSGGPLSFEASQATEAFLGVRPIEVYGSTETGGIAYRTQQIQPEPWIAFKGISLSLGERERLCITSPYIPEGSQFQTEDRVSLINENTFHLLGRTDHIVKVEGKRICLLEIEKRLQDIDVIQEARIIPLDSLNRDELGAIIVLSNQGEFELLSLGKFKFVRELRKRLSEYFESVVLPRKWRFVSSIPLNAQGKSSYALLKATFGELG